MTKAIVIYYDGNENRAVLRDVPEYVDPGSAAPHVWGLPADSFVQAVIACSLDSSEKRMMTSRNWHEFVEVCVDEILYIAFGEEQDP